FSLPAHLPDLPSFPTRRSSDLVLNVLVLLKVSALAALILGGAFLPEPGHSVAGPPGPSARNLPLAFGAALVPIMFAYGGWQSATWVAEEIRDPERNLPRAMIAGTIAVVSIYVLAN